MSEALFIDDGCTETVGFYRVPGVHPELELTIRPFKGDERDAALSRVALGPTAFKQDPRKRDPAKMRREQRREEQQKRSREYLAGRIVSWSVDAEPTAETLEKLNPALYSRIHDYVYKYGAADFAVVDGKRVDVLSNAPVEDDEKN